jgi:hypothetical protein
VQWASVQSNLSSCAVFFFLGLGLGAGIESAPVEGSTVNSAKPASWSSSFFYLVFLILLVHGIPETSQESIGFVEESLTL